MANKLYEMQKLTADVSRDVAASSEEWMKFLDTAARLYRYTFPEQLLIYAQRPEATAVASMEIWNKRMYRWINRGSRGIALIDNTSGPRMKLRYVFDIQDTHKVKNLGRDPKLWEMIPAGEQLSAEYLQNQFSLEEVDGGLAETLRQAARESVQEWLPDAFDELLLNVPDTYLEELDEQNQRVEFQELMENSTWYVLLKRSGLDVKEYLGDEDFQKITDFNELKVMVHLGTAVNEICRPILMQLGRYVLTELENDLETVAKEKEVVYNEFSTLIRENNNITEDDNRQEKEEDIEHESNHLQSERKLSDTGHQHEGEQRNDREVRNDAERISEEPQNSQVQSDDTAGNTGRSSGSNRQRSQTESGRPDRTASSAESGTEQNGRRTGMDTSYESDQSAGRGAGNSGGYLQLSLFQTEEEQIEEIRKAAAEVEQPAAFFITDEVVDDVLRTGSGKDNTLSYITAKLVEDLEHDELRQYLVLHYGTGGKGFDFSGQKISVWYDQDGLRFRRGESARKNFDRMVTWEEATERIQNMYNDGTFVSQNIMLGSIEAEINRLSGLLALHFRDTGRGEKYFSFPEAQELIRGGLEDPEITREYYQRLVSLEKDMENHPDQYLGYQIRNNARYKQDVYDLDRTLCWTRQQEKVDIPKLSFITQDEIDSVLRGGGSVAEGRHRIYEYCLEHHDTKEIAEFLKNEFGTGGSPSGITGAESSERWNDAKGLQLSKGKISNPDISVLLKWNKVAERIRQLVRTEDYLSPEEYAAYQEREEAQQLADMQELQSQLPDAELSEDAETEEPLFPDQQAITNELPAQEDSEISEPISAVNFHITDDALGRGTSKEKFRANIMAIQLLKKCESENRHATAEEQEILSRYVGWGGLADAFDENKPAWETEYLELKTVLTPEEYAAARASTLNAHYTQPIVIESMYQALENMGFEKGNILEPAMGVGNFFGMLPEKMEASKLYGVELDSISGRIASLLYPDANIQIKGFEKTDYPNDFFDVVIGNVPFGAYKVNDRQYEKYNFFIHDYFLAKSIDQLRPGGVAALITTKGTMDKASPEVRRYLAERAELLGAIRLPNTAFSANAGTEVTADILFFQKRESIAHEEPEWIQLGSDANGIRVNQYFAEHPEMILGKMEEVSGPYGMETTCSPMEGADLEIQLSEAIRHIQGTMTPAFDRESELDEMIESIPADPNVRNYSFTVVDDQIYYRINSLMNPVKMPAMTAERVKGMIGVRDTVRELIALQMDEYASDEDIAALQKRLNEVYDAYTEKYGVIGSNANKRAFSDDSSYCLLCSLEDLNEDGTLKRKADMFYKRTIKRAVAVTSVETSSEALAVSMNEKAKGDGTFNVYDDLKQKLLEKGVPEKEIAFIHDANTETKKAELFSKVKAGQVRFLLGSTAKMGAGTNVQDRLIALHHLDVGWKPSDLEQREGRIIRQGNHNKRVKIFRYVTESTFDSYMWQLIENKQKFISQIMTSKAPVRSCEDVDEAALSYAEVKALATGNPAVKEKMSLDVEVAKLKLLKANHLNNVYRMEADISRNLPQKIAKLTEIIEGYREDITHYEAHKITDPEAFEMEIGGKIFTEKKEAGAALLAVCKLIQSVNEAKDVGNYQGFHMMARFDSWNKEFILSVKHTAVSSLPLGSDPLGNIARINNLLESYPKKLADAEQKLETVKEQLENAKQEVVKPFPKEKELNQMMERLSELNALLNMDEQGSSEEPENSGKQSIHDKLNAIKQNGQQEHDRDKPAKAACGKCFYPGA